MDRIEFIKQMGTICKRDLDDSTLRAYDTALSVPYPVDWSKFFNFCISDMEKLSMPTPKYLLANIHNFKLRDERYIQNEGSTVRFYLKSGRFVDYTVCGFGMSLAQIREKCKQTDRVLKAVMYPPEVALIGEHIVPEDAEGRVIFQIEGIENVA